METLKLHIQIAAVKVLPLLKGCFGFMPQFVYKNMKNPAMQTEWFYIIVSLVLNKKQVFPTCYLKVQISVDILF